MKNSSPAELGFSVVADEEKLPAVLAPERLAPALGRDPRSLAHRRERLHVHFVSSGCARSIGDELASGENWGSTSLNGD
jgi:hypothetical protein